MEVYLDPESIQIGSGYYPLPMGNIYFVDDVGAFPDYDYLDFVSIVLVWWTNELMSFAWGAKTVKLRFVDEHYYIHLIHEQVEPLSFVMDASVGPQAIEEVVAL